LQDDQLMEARCRGSQPGTFEWLGHYLPSQQDSMKAVLTLRFLTPDPGQRQASPRCVTLLRGEQLGGVGQNG
jgi:hypothetical protein